MGMKVPYGEADFYSIRTEGYLYIDKTKYIELLEQNKKLIYTRPRRFGKSSLINMLDHYYSIDEAENYEKLFKGLYVYDHPTPYKNQYYILNFNFSGMNATEQAPLEDIEDSFNKKVSVACRSFVKRYDLDIQFNENDKAYEILNNVLAQFKALRKENKIYILIDEYDHFTNGLLQGNAKKFLKILGDTGFVRAFYEVIKENLEISNPPVARFFATGVAPITLDSLTSGFNITTRITNNPLFEAMCGLTDEEVKQAIEMAGIEGEEKEKTFEKMKANYDGYRFNKFTNSHLFNTTLVMYYLRDLVQLGMPPENLIDGNLAATGSKIENIAGLIDREENYKALNELLMNGEIVANLTESFELEKKFSRDDFISMLYYNGYITIKELDGMELKFGIPNFVTETLCKKLQIA